MAVIQWPAFTDHGSMHIASIFYACGFCSAHREGGFADVSSFFIHSCIFGTRRRRVIHRTVHFVYNLVFLYRNSRDSGSAKYAIAVGFCTVTWRFAFFSF